MLVFIGALQKTTLADFPGKVACIVFLVNCNFKCKFCYNKELTSHKFFKKGKRELVDEKYFFDFLNAKKKMLDGVVVTGGEPTVTPGLLDFLRKIKALGFALKLDTNGTNPQTLRKALEEKLLDYVAMDVKSPFLKYQEITQSKVNPDKIKESIYLLMSSSVPHEFRTTLYPKLTKEDLVEMATYIPHEKWFLQHFQSKNVLDPKSRRLKPMKNHEVKEIIKSLDGKVDVHLRGD